MRKPDQVSSLVSLAIAVFICVESLRLPLGSFQDPGSGFFPLGSGIILGILSIVLYLKSHVSKSVEMGKSWFPKEGWRKLISFLVILFGYTTALGILGFFLSTSLLLAFLFRLVQPKNWIVVLGSGALASYLAYIIFEKWLELQLPDGFLGF